MGTNTKTPTARKSKKPATFIESSIERTALLSDMETSDLHISVKGFFDFDEEEPLDHYRLQLVLDTDAPCFDEEFEADAKAAGAPSIAAYLHSIAPGLHLNGNSLVLAEAAVTRVHSALDGFTGAFEALDNAGGDYLCYLPLFEALGEWVSDLDDVLESFDADLLIIDAVNVAPAWRGRQLGALLAASAVERLGRGCRAAACFPAPLGGASQAKTPAHKRAVSKLTNHWQSVGFTPWKKGISLLDTASFSEYSRLVKEAGKPVPTK